MVHILNNVNFKYFVPISEALSAQDGSKDLIIKGTAINETVTRNGVMYEAVELEKAAPSLSGKPLLKDHENKVDSIVGKVFSSSYNQNGKKVDFQAKVMDEKVKEMITDGRISNVSIGAFAKEAIQNEEGTYVTVKGLEFVELSLVAVPADPNAGLMNSSFCVKLHEMLQEANKDETSATAKEQSDEDMMKKCANMDDMPDGDMKKMCKAWKDKKNSESLRLENEQLKLELQASKTKSVKEENKMEPQVAEKKSEDVTASVVEAMKALAESQKTVAAAVAGMATEIQALKQSQASAAKADEKEAVKTDSTKGIVATERTDEEKGVQLEDGMVIERSVSGRGHSIWRLPSAKGELKSR